MAGEDPAYEAWTKTLPCAARALSPCQGSVTGHHAGTDKGVGKRAHDRSCIPMCFIHHGYVHANAGPFKGWTRSMRRAWADVAIAETQARWKSEQSVAGELTYVKED